MRGGYLHSRAIARKLELELERLGARLWTEYPAGPGRRAGSVDIYAEFSGVRLACEIELGARRIPQDLRKAEALGVDVLLIVTPTAAVARAVRNRLRTLRPARVQVQVRPFGSAIKYLSTLSAVEGRQDKKTEKRPPDPRDQP